MEDAISFGRKTRNAITITFALLRDGVQIGKHEEFFDATEVKTAPPHYRPYVKPTALDGLVVYPADAAVSFLGMNFAAKRGAASERLQKTFSKSLELSDKLTSRLAIAFELYNSHHFETSLHARFLQLVSVVECLATSKRQAAPIVQHIDEMILLSKKELTATTDVS